MVVKGFCYLLIFFSFFTLYAQNCIITNFEAYANVNGCDPFWTMDGVVEFQNQPVTGDLIFEDCEGNLTVLASAPFTSPVNYAGVIGPTTTLSQNSCNFEVYFSDEPSCSLIENIVLPANAPPEEAGTVTQNLSGEGLNNFILCDGDTLTINSNDDYSIQTTDPTDNPSLIYLVYSCPPSPGGVGVNPFLDPCFQNYFTAEDITLINNGGSSDPLIQALGNPTDNIFYIVPITAVDVDGTNITITQDCYDLALDQMTTVQYLNPIVTSLTENCPTSEAYINIQGGYTEFYFGPGTNNTVSNIQPSSLTFNGTSIGNNGNLILEFLTEGMDYSFDITGANGCTASFAATYIIPDDASFSYPLSTFCITDTDPSPTVTGINGGVFSSTAGLDLDPISGTIDLSTSIPGNYAVVYQTPPSLCAGRDTFDIVIHGLPNIIVSNNGPICEGQTVSLTANNAATYIWNNGLGAGQNQTDTPLTNTSYIVTATDINGCTNTATTNVIVNTLPIVDAGNDFSICDGASTTLTGSGAQTYTWDNGVVDGNLFTPSNTATYTVVGTDANGCSNTDQVTIQLNPLPIITTGSNQILCESQSVVLNASGATTISWDNGVMNSVSFVPPIGTLTYTATGVDDNGCVNSTSVDITVNPNPVVSISGSTQYCLGGNTTLIANSLSAVSYAWSSGGNSQSEVVTSANNPISVVVTDANGCFSSSSITNVIEVVPSITNTSVSICQGQTTLIHGNIESIPGVYSQVFTDQNGCDSTSNVNLIVNSLPVLDPGANSVVCENTPIVLSGSGAQVLIWDNAVVNNIPFTPPVGNTIYTLTGTDLNGCSNTVTVNVEVLQNPSVNAGADFSLCEGEQAVLNVTTSIANTVSWDNGVQDGIPFVSPLGNTNYEVTVTDLNGCTSSDVVTVTVNPLPIVDGGFDQLVCEGQFTVFNATGAFSYVWSNGVLDGQPFVPLQDTSYVVTGTSTFGCSASDTVFIQIEQSIPIVFSADQIQGCSPLNVSFIGTDIQNSTCSWDFGNGFSSTSCGLSSSVFLNSGCYDISYTVTSQNGCSNTAFIADYICVDENPEALFTASTSQISIDDSEVSFINNSVGATNYFWEFSDQGSSSEVSPNFEFNVEEIGSYPVSLTAISDLGCVDTFTLILQGVEDLLFYVPNTFTPDGNEFNNEFLPIFPESFVPEDYNLKIFNRWGQICFESNNPAVGWDGTYGLSLSTRVQMGVYVWKIELKTESSDDIITKSGHVTVVY
ncbi:MAG: gliding motility-associated C-terminal domain-containing protein [Lishizhenia sp.]